MVNITLVAKKGFILTNNKAYAKEITLGTGDSPQNWHQITLEEYEQILNAPPEELTEEDYLEALRSMGVEV